VFTIDTSTSLLNMQGRARRHPRANYGLQSWPARITDSHAASIVVP
jgi:hypothetical protein